MWDFYLDWMIIPLQRRDNNQKTSGLWLSVGLHLIYSAPQQEKQRASALPAFSALVLFDIPRVFCHGAGTTVQCAGGQSQLDAKLLHISHLGYGRQSVGASSPKEVTKRRLHGWQVGGDERRLNLEPETGAECKRMRQTFRVRVEPWVRKAVQA